MIAISGLSLKEQPEAKSDAPSKEATVVSPYVSSIEEEDILLQSDGETPVWRRIQLQKKSENLS